MSGATTRKAAPTAAPAEPMTWERIKLLKKPVTRSVTICLEPVLVDAIAAASTDDERSRAEEDATGASVMFKVQSIGGKRFRELLKAHPAPEGEGVMLFDPEAFPVALVAACAVEPLLTVDEAQELLDELDQGSGEALFLAAWEACTVSSVVKR